MYLKILAKHFIQNVPLNIQSRISDADKSSQVRRSKKREADDCKTILENATIK